MLARTIANAALRRLREGRLTIVEAGRRTTHGTSGAHATITVHDARFWNELLRRGSVGLGRAYASGWFDADDLATFVEIAARNVVPIQAWRDRAADRIAPLRDRIPTSSRGSEVDRSCVAAHYDLSNDLFALMLDPTLSYSCAMFVDPTATLEEAQVAKLDRLCELLELGPDDHLLEIGTGWGGLAVHAASRYGCRVTTTTISAEQHDHASKLVAELGLAGRVDVLDVDYRDLTGTYDKIVSVEMIEAVDWRDHPEFFSTLAARVRPGGKVVLQAIVIADGSYERAKRHTDFIKAFVFPGGCLPSVRSIERSARATGVLRTAEVTHVGRHYPETLRRWQQNIELNRDAMRDLGFDDGFERTWDLYLSYCIGAFQSAQIDVVHVVLER